MVSAAGAAFKHTGICKLKIKSFVCATELGNHKWALLQSTCNNT